MDAELRKSLKQMVIGLCALFAGLVIAGWLLRHELQAAGRWMVDTMGYWGIVAGVFAADCLTFPLPADVYLALSITAEMDKWTVIWVATITSIVAGACAYGIGRFLSRTRFAQRLMSPFYERGTRFIDRWGTMGVIIAALTPVPFSIVSVLAGTMAMHFHRFVLACLFRFPRIWGYYLLIDLGWNIAAGA